jgi:hypothetical protein
MSRRARFRRSGCVASIRISAGRKRINQRTSRHLTCIALAHGIRQRVLHCPQVGDLCLHFREMTRRELAHAGAGSFAGSH